MRCDDDAVGVSTIVQKTFHILDGGGECLRADRGGVAVERHHVVAPTWPILKNEDFAPALGPQVEQLIARTAKETGEIEVAGFECAMHLLGLLHHRLSS